MASASSTFVAIAARISPSRRSSSARIAEAQIQFAAHLAKPQIQLSAYLAEPQIKIFAIDGDIAARIGKRTCNVLRLLCREARGLQLTGKLECVERDRAHRAKNAPNISAVNNDRTLAGQRQNLLPAGGKLLILCQLPAKPATSNRWEDSAMTTTEIAPGIGRVCGSRSKARPTFIWPSYLPMAPRYCTPRATSC